MAESNLNLDAKFPTPAPGTAGVNSQLNGVSATASGVAGATGGLAPGNFIERDVDSELYNFKSDDTPLMQMMLKAKKVQVNSPEVDHYMIDEPRSSIMTTAAIAASSATQVALPLGSADVNIPQEFDTLLVRDVDGYAEDGKTKTPGKELMLFVVGKDATTGYPVVCAVNGPKTNTTDESCTTPAIPAGTTLVLLANALYETQKEVAPSVVVPQPSTVYLQKRGLNQIVSDYFDAQIKRIPFSKAAIAEAAITDFKVKGNRTLYAGRKGKKTINVPKLGVQAIYFTEGVRYQVRKELQLTGKLTIEQLIALAKMIFTGEDVPKSVVLLAGKNLLENIQCIDYSKHPEVQVIAKENTLGWAITSIHTVFGDIELKHEPALDRLCWSNSGFITSLDRLVHYQLTAEHTTNDRVQGEEATRTSVLVWDALALKGSCHIWVNGETSDDPANYNGDAAHFLFWNSEEAPADAPEGQIYYLTADCPGISSKAMAGQTWQKKGAGESASWVEYLGFATPAE